MAAMLLFFFSCKKESFITSGDARLYTSADTVKFDTVFTTTGSVTQSFKIFNDNDQKLRFSSIKLMGGSTSPFKININGVAATELNNLEVAANDSIYVFVSVTVNPTAANLPFILADSISINFNGNTRFVQLQAYGQNAVFLNSVLINSNTTFTNNLPYVILGGMQVASNVTLTLAAGTRIYAHANAPILVDGTLIANGTISNKVTFTGDRLDAPYNKFPASWPGIYFRAGSKNNQLTFTDVRNATQAVVVQQPSVNANPKLIIHQSIIDNAYEVGLLCINTSVQADNSLISNCGANISIQLGGNYNFTNCTMAAYSNNNLLHKLPVVNATNFADVNGATATADLGATFKNCIFWGDNGNVDNEISVQKQGGNAFSVIVDHCLYKASTDPANTTFIASLKNIDPIFDTIDTRFNVYDFRTTKDPASPVIKAGAAAPFPKDLDDHPRNILTPDIGCYQKQ